jgi:hypothetical protein
MNNALAVANTYPPQFLKTRRIGGGVPNAVLNVPVAEIILNELRVRALVELSTLTDKQLLLWL